MTRARRIAFAGDSTAVGVGDTSTLALGGYRSPLLEALTTLWGTMPIPVGNTRTGGLGHNDVMGQSGLTCAELAARLAYEAADHAPEVIFLHIGTNDCTQLNSQGSPLLSSSMTSLALILDTIRADLPDTIVYIAKIIPNVVAGSQVDAYNAALEALVLARDDYAAGLLVLVDVHGAFVANPTWATDYMADNSHPSRAGYALEAATFLAIAAEGI